MGLHQSDATDDIQEDQGGGCIEKILSRGIFPNPTEQTGNGEYPQSEQNRDSLIFTDYSSEEDTEELRRRKQEFEKGCKLMVELLLNRREEPAAVHWVVWDKTSDDPEGLQLGTGRQLSESPHSCEGRNSLVMDDDGYDEDCRQETLENEEERGAKKNGFKRQSNEFLVPYM
ncbi:hypothetical protein GN956_G8889 [Arapaima gigas]